MENTEVTKWLIDNVPFCDSLDPNELDNLCKLYVIYSKSSKRCDKILDMAFNHNLSGIDYSTDYEKAISDAMNEKQELNNYLQQLKEKYVQDQELNNDKRL